jgi:membrane protein
MVRLRATGLSRSRAVLLPGFFLTAVPRLGRALLSTRLFRLHQRFSLFSQSLVGSSGRTQHKVGFSSKIKDITGPEAAGAMQAMVEHAHRASGSGIAAAVSVVLLLVGASATFSSLNTALDIVFKVESRKGISGLALLLRARLVSFGLVMGFGFLLVVSLVLDTAIQTVGHAVLGTITLTVVAAIAQTIFGLVVMTAGFGALIKWLPDVHVRFKNALVGGAVAAVLFAVGRHLFGLYLTRAGTAGSFGAAGSLAVLMMWLYFSAAVFLIGAEVTAILQPSRQPKAPGVNQQNRR